MELRFCRRCGQELAQQAEGVFVCPQRHHTFASPSPCVGVLFLKDMTNLVVARRAIDPGKGMLDCIGGFVDTNETFEEAVIREIAEETGLSSGDYSELTYLCSAYRHYSYEDEARPVISVFFVAHLSPSAVLTATDDVAEIVTLPLESIDLNLFDADDAKAAITRLQKEML